MAADALARLAKKTEELETAKNDYHDLLVQRDSRIEVLEKALTAIRGDVSNIRKEKDELGRELSSHKEKVINMTVAMGKVEKELKQQTGLANYDREMHEKLHKESVAHDKEMKQSKEASRKFMERISELTATNKQLHERVDDLEAQKQTLETANSNFASNQDDNQNEVSHATKEFEQMFKDLGRNLDLNGYVSHIRDLVSTGQLKRQSSQLSLERHLSPQKSEQELRAATGKSLQDQLAAVDDASSDHSVPRPGEAEDDEDETITDLGLGRTFTEYDYFVRLQKQEQKIIELEKINAELLSKGKTNDAIATTTNGAVQTDVLATTNSTTQTDAFTTNNAATGNLGIARYPGAEIQPFRPAPRATVNKIPLREPGITELWARVPGLYKFILFAMLLIYFIVFAGVVSERHIWLSANKELTRQHVVRMGSGGPFRVFSPILMAVDTLVGVDNAPLG